MTYNIRMFSLPDIAYTTVRKRYLGFLWLTIEQFEATDKELVRNVFYYWANKYGQKTKKDNLPVGCKNCTSTFPCMETCGVDPFTKREP